MSMRVTSTSIGTLPHVRIRLAKFVLLAPALFSVSAMVYVGTGETLNAFLMLAAAIAGAADYIAKSIVVTPNAIVLQSYRRVEVIDPAMFVSVERTSFLKHRVMLRSGERWAPFSYPSLTHRIADAIAEMSSTHD